VDNCSDHRGQAAIGRLARVWPTAIMIHTPVHASRAGGDGVAQISFTPDQSGFYDLEVYATTRDGLELTPYDYFFIVN
jgi:hypothetical protein